MRTFIKLSVMAFKPTEDYKIWTEEEIKKSKIDFNRNKNKNDNDYF